MQIRLAASITAPPLASWGLTGEGGRDPEDKGGTKTGRQHNQMRLSGSTKNTLCHWLNGECFN